MPVWLTALWPIGAIAAGVIVLSSVSEALEGNGGGVSGLGGFRKKSRRYPTSHEIRIAFKMAKRMR